MRARVDTDESESSWKIIERAYDCAFFDGLKREWRLKLFI